MTDSQDAAVYQKLLAEERLILASTELIAEVMDKRDISRSQLAEMLGVSKGEVTQRLSGTRNLTLRSLADMLNALDADIDVSVRYRELANQHLIAPVSTTVREIVLHSGANWITVPQDWKGDDRRSDMALAA